MSSLSQPPRAAPVLLAFALACSASIAQVQPSAAPAAAASIPPGAWSAWLDSPGGELPFELFFASSAEGKLQCHLGASAQAERIAVAELEGQQLRLGITHYDAQLQASLSADGSALDGLWTKRRSATEFAQLPFHARLGAVPRFAQVEQAADASQGARFNGRWAVRFASQNEPAVGLFGVAADGLAVGTFLTSTGDWRQLRGRVAGERLLLSAFDGAHALLFDARLGADGALSGEFWAGDKHHDTWTGTLDPGAALADGFAEVHADTRVRFDDLSYLDLEGQPVSMADPMFGGKVRVVQLMGSWCPNCSDESLLLGELDAKYRNQGLLVIGLGFEVTGDVERDARQLKIHAARHHLRYPVLLAGKADRAEAAKAFPLLDRIKAFPTTLFLDSAGNVRAVYSGFSGPATGPEYEKLRASFESTIQQLLAGKARNALETWSLISKNSWVYFTDELGLGYDLRMDERGQPMAKERVYTIDPNTEVEGLTLQQERDVPLLASSTGVRLGGLAWRYEADAQVLIASWDCGLRLSPNGRSTTPLLEGANLRSAEGIPKALASEKPLVRCEAIAAVVLDPRPEIKAQLARLVPLLSDPDVQVRATACWAARALKLGAAKPHLIRHLSDPDPAVRREAARALLVLAPAEAPGLFAAAGVDRDPDPIVRRTAAGQPPKLQVGAAPAESQPAEPADAK